MKSIQHIIVTLLLLCAPIRCVALGYTSYSGTSEAPTMQMRSTSVWAGQRSDVRTVGTQGGGFYTAASGVTGGVTTYDSYNPARDGYGASGPSRGMGWPGTPDIFPTPIGDGWDVWVMMALLAAGYAFIVWRKKQHSLN